MWKKLLSSRRYLRALLILISIGGLCASLFRVLEREPLPARKTPETLPHTQITARYVEEEGLLAVTQTMEIRNDTGEDWPKILLQLPVNAYKSEEFSPAASAEWAEASYPDGFSEGFLTLDWAGADGVSLSPEFLSDERTACLLPLAVSGGGSVTLQLRYRLYLPFCLHRFGQDDRTIRLFHVFPALGVWQDGRWLNDEICSVGDGWNAPMNRFSFEVELPRSWTLAAGCAVQQKGLLHSGVLPAADDLCLAVFKEPVRHEHRQAGGTSLTVYGADGGQVQEAAGWFAPYLEKLAGLYGPSPLEKVTVCLLPYYEDVGVFPGLIVLNENQFVRFRQTMPDIAWAAAWQWFGAGFSTDGFWEHWLSAALSEWAGQQALARVRGQDALEERRRTFVDEAMRENLHLSLTPGSPLSYFPDESTLDTLARGRGCAFLIAADMMCGGRLNEFLRDLAQNCFYQRLTESQFLGRLNRFFSMDVTPLWTDYIHTLY